MAAAAPGRNNARRPGPAPPRPAVLKQPPPPAPRLPLPPPPPPRSQRAARGCPRRRGRGRAEAAGPVAPTRPGECGREGAERCGRTFLSSLSLPCRRSGWPLSAAGAGSAGCPSRWCGRWCGQPPAPAAGGMGSGHGETPLTSISIFQFTVLRDKSRRTLSTTPLLSLAFPALFSSFLLFLAPFLPACLSPSRGRGTHGSGCTAILPAILPTFVSSVCVCVCVRECGVRARVLGAVAFSRPDSANADGAALRRGAQLAAPGLSAPSVSRARRSPVGRGPLNKVERRSGGRARGRGRPRGSARGG